MSNRLGEEFRKILPVWVFFFVTFGLLAFTRAATLGEYHIESFEPPEYFVGSLIMAKVVLLVDALFKNRRFQRSPLIYSTLGNTGLYFIAALALHHIERIFTLMRHQHVGVREANREVLLAVEKPTFWAMMTAVLVLTFIFCMLRQLIQAIGSERFIEMFFGRRRRIDRAA